MAAEFKNELIKLVEGSGRNVSASKIQSLTKIALKNVDEADEILDCLERFCISCESYYKLHALYVIDSICKASRAKLGDRDTYHPAFSKRIVRIFESLIHYAPKDGDKIRHVLNVWREKQMFSDEIMDAIDDSIRSNSSLRIRESKTNHTNEKEWNEEEFRDETLSKYVSKSENDLLGFDYGEEEDDIDEEEMKKLAELQKRIIEAGSKAAIETQNLLTSQGPSSKRDSENSYDPLLHSSRQKVQDNSQIITVYSRTLCFDNLPANLTEQQIYDLCTYYGPVDQFHYLSEKKRVFVKYSMRTSADAAKVALNGYEIFGSPLKTRWVCTLGRPEYFDFSTGILMAPKNSFQNEEWSLLYHVDKSGYVCEEPHRTEIPSIPVS
jgi:hypothetical protein